LYIDNSKLFTHTVKLDHNTVFLGWVILTSTLR